MILQGQKLTFLLQLPAVLPKVKISVASWAIL
jgi:hypothetical protein